MLTREDLPVLPYAIAGAAQGFLCYYVQPELTAKRAWAVALGGIALYEAFCPKGELMSEGVDRAMEKHPILTAGAIAVTAAHLANVLPDRLDPFHQITNIIKGN